eukprot:250799_1
MFRLFVTIFFILAERNKASRRLNAAAASAAVAVGGALYQVTDMCSTCDLCNDGMHSYKGLDRDGDMKFEISDDQALRQGVALGLTFGLASMKKRMAVLTIDCPDEYIQKKLKIAFEMKQGMTIRRAAVTAKEHGYYVEDFYTVSQEGCFLNKHMVLAEE